jgi:hypothetical protein
VEKITDWVRVSERGLKAGSKNNGVYLKVKNRIKELKK